MNMNIDTEGVVSGLNKISSSIERINSKATGLQSSLYSAASGFQSENYGKVEAAVEQSMAAMHDMISNLESVQSYINELIAIAENYLNLKY